MTLVSLPSPIIFPGILGNLTGTPFTNSIATVDAAGEYVAHVFTARENMTVSHVGFLAGTATGSPTIEVRIETVDASGLPSGTLWATNTNGTTGTVASNTYVLQALTASASITKGQVFCVKILYASGTSLTLPNSVSIMNPVQTGMPYKVINTGTPTKSVLDSIATIALGSSSTTFYSVPGTVPLTTFTAGTFNNTSSAKRGLRFVLPMNARMIGIRWYNSTAAGDYNILLMDDAGNELSSSSTAFDGDHSGGNNPISNYFDNAVTGAAGTAYRIAIEPASATNVNVTTITLPSSNYFSASPAGSTAVYATFTSGGGWVDSTTQLPLMDVILDQIDNGAGGGGALPYVIG